MTRRTVDSLSPVQFGFAAHREAIAMDTDQRMVRANFAPKRINLDKTTFRATQRDMSKSTVAHYEARSPYAGSKGYYATRPEVIKRGDEHIVWDGHHRIAAARRKGQKTMTVDYQDLAANQK